MVLRISFDQTLVHWMVERQNPQVHTLSASRSEYIEVSSYRCNQPAYHTHWKLFMSETVYVRNCLRFSTYTHVNIMQIITSVSPLHTLQPPSKMSTDRRSVESTPKKRVPSPSVSGAFCRVTINAPLYSTHHIYWHVMSNQLTCGIAGTHTRLMSVVTVRW